MEWYSQSDQLPQDMDNDKWVFIRKSMSYVNEMIVMKKYNDACLLLEKIKKYQQKECDGLLPADNKFKAEKIYNQFDYSKSVAMACICIGLICFIYYCHCMASQKRTSRKAIIILNILLWIVFTYLSAAICLRGYVSIICHCPTASKPCSSWHGVRYCSLFCYNVNSQCCSLSVSCFADLR